MHEIRLSMGHHILFSFHLLLVRMDILVDSLLFLSKLPTHFGKLLRKVYHWKDKYITQALLL